MHRYRVNCLVHDGVVVESFEYTSLEDAQLVAELALNLYEFAEVVTII